MSRTDELRDTGRRWQELLAELAGEVAGLSTKELPDFLGEIARLDARARLRLGQGSPAPAEEPEDRLLTAREVAERLHEKPSWVYAHRRELPAVALPGRTVRFSERRLQGFIRRRASG